MEDTEEIREFGDIIVFDIIQEEEHRHPETWTEIYTPVISGDFVAWVEDIYGYPDIQAFDLSAKKGFTICGKDGQQLRPDIDGDIIVWEDHRNYRDSQSDIYGARIIRRSR